MIAAAAAAAAAMVETTLASSAEVLPNFLIYDTISATPTSRHHHLVHLGGTAPTASFPPFSSGVGRVSGGPPLPLQEAAALTGAAGGGRKPARKRRRKPRSCKNKEEAESQRMTHIAVERNRRRLMNEHLAVLRSLMPESYIQRGDQASIVGGAIDFVKELEQLLQSLEVQKRKLQQQKKERKRDAGQDRLKGNETTSMSMADTTDTDDENRDDDDSRPFAQFFAYPQYMWRHVPKDYTPENHRSPAVADIEVTLIETHASLRILSLKRPGQLLKMVAGFQALQLTILHLNVTTLDPMVLYSFSAKVEEGCSLASVDDIAAAVHHMLSLIEAEATISV